MTSFYFSASEIARAARGVCQIRSRDAVVLDRANDGWLDPMTGIVSDRYVSDIRVVPRSLTGAARYSAAVALLRELRASQSSHHPHKNAA